MKIIEMKPSEVADAIMFYLSQHDKSARAWDVEWDMDLATFAGAIVRIYDETDLKTGL